MNEKTILVIDDEASICKLLSIALKANAYKVLTAYNAKEGEKMVASHQPDLVLLDLGLPDDDGQNVLKILRGWYLKPIIILSARFSEEEIIRALDNGANDYLVKPFRTGELLARIRTALRQNEHTQNIENVLSFRNLTIDIPNRTVKKNGEILKLTTTEYALLILLVKNEGKVLTHQFILREIWGPGYIEHSEYPRVFVGQLRKKIEENPNNPLFIITESGVGYRFVTS